MFWFYVKLKNFNCLLKLPRLPLKSTKLKLHFSTQVCLTTIIPNVPCLLWSHTYNTLLILTSQCVKATISYSHKFGLKFFVLTKLLTDCLVSFVNPDCQNSSMVEYKMVQMLCGKFSRMWQMTTANKMIVSFVSRNVAFDGNVKIKSLLDLVCFLLMPRSLCWRKKGLLGIVNGRWQEMKVCISSIGK